jgi:FkbM family methyltransferase
MTTMLPQYESMLEAVYRAALQPGDVAVDIGAHVGRHTFPIARAVGPAGKVFAFEPLPTVYADLCRSVETARSAERDLAAIVIHNLALGEEEGEAKFVFVPDFPEYSGFRKRTYHDGSVRKETIDVRVRRLDSFRAELGKVQFIKIDAEGGELTIQRGARRSSPSRRQSFPSSWVTPHLRTTHTRQRTISIFLSAMGTRCSPSSASRFRGLSSFARRRSSSSGITSPSPTGVTGQWV